MKFYFFIEFCLIFLFGRCNKWKDNNPDCIKSNSKKNDLYLNIVSNSMNGITKEEGEKNINKIISNVAKNVIIEK